MGRCLSYFAACMPICSWIFWRSFRGSRMTRRQFIRRALCWSALSNRMVANAAAISLRCTPAPSFPVPLSEGIWRIQEFPVGKHDYHVWLDVDRRMPLEELYCGLGPPRPGYQCNTPPLLDLEWRIWDGTTLVKNWPAKPIQAGAWSERSTSPQWPRENRPPVARSKPASGRVRTEIVFTLPQVFRASRFSCAS